MAPALPGGLGAASGDTLQEGARGPSGGVDGTLVGQGMVPWERKLLRHLLVPTPRAVIPAHAVFWGLPLLQHLQWLRITYLLPTFFV